VSANAASGFVTAASLNSKARQVSERFQLALIATLISAARTARVRLAERRVKAGLAIRDCAI
jgi:hypothetical protein